MSDTLKNFGEALAKANQLRALMAQIAGEVACAEASWPPMNSAHEAYAVLLEEVDELWDHVKTSQKKRDIPAMRAEAIQVAAMAVRFIRDVCDGGRARS
jgi:hypothetical protein